MSPWRRQPRARSHVYLRPLRSFRLVPMARSPIRIPHWSAADRDEAVERQVTASGCRRIGTANAIHPDGFTATRVARLRGVQLRCHLREHAEVARIRAGRHVFCQAPVSLEGMRHIEVANESEASLAP